MLIYLRKITASDTKKQIEATKEAYQYFFKGDIASNSGVEVNIDILGKTAKFRVSKARGKANSYRFSSADGEEAFRKFINSSLEIELVEGDILRLRTTRENTYKLDIVRENNSEYDLLSKMIKSKDNTVMVVESDVEEDLKLGFEDEKSDNKIPWRFLIEERFKSWLSKQITQSRKQATPGAISSNTSALKEIWDKISITGYENIKSVFDITDINTYKEIRKEIKSLPNYNELNEDTTRFLGSSLKWYEEFLNDFSFYTNINSPFSHNRILFGAPGTGKSYRLTEDLNRKKEKVQSEKGMHEGLLVGYEDNYERVTFHPDYSYSNFVGTYKPVPVKDENGKDIITYKYVPGPFMRSYVKALKSIQSADPQPFVLIIEEINRANVAAVFGDVFQLLDRKDNNISEYPIQASEDIKKYLADELGGESNDYKEIKIPNNLFIWATMNSADQGVFPMDTAFKRRWEFTYLGIDENEDGIKEFEVALGEGKNRRKVNWNKLRKAINKKLSEFKINEDKLIGPYFISKSVLGDSEKFINIFKNKVLMYLFDDAAKHKRSSLFENTIDFNIYSVVCKEFENKGIFIFPEDIYSNFKDSSGNDGKDEKIVNNPQNITTEGD